MRPIACLVSSNVLEGRPEARSDAHEFTRQRAALAPAAAEAGFELVPAVWDEAFDAAAYDAVVIGPTWDYWDKLDAYLAFLDAVSERALLLNPAKVVRWNIEKTYLKDLAALGAPVIPTVWADRASPDAIAEGFERFGAETLVVKPVTGAGAWRQAKVRRGEPLPAPEALPPRRAMIQPFLPAIADEGEYSFLFFGGEFSHALRKVPARGDYRIQGMYGGTESPHLPEKADLDLARACLAAACRRCGVDTLLYARVDMARGLDGQLALMEIELIEPYYYPEQGPDCGAVFARALTRILG
jgi:glutathione synthase/RimK-type ligase-like ATP-grasp enzyme